MPQEEWTITGLGTLSKVVRRAVAGIPSRMELAAAFNCSRAKCIAY